MILSWFRSTGLHWLAAALLTLFGVILWARDCLVSLDIDALLRQTSSSTVWGMHGCLVAITAGIVALAPRLYGLLGPRRMLTALGLALAGYLACGLAPRAHRILFDEHIYMQIGQTIAHTGRAESATYARTEYGDFQLIDSSVNKQPNGLPYLHSLAYRLFGVSTTVSHHLNRSLIGLAAAGLYLALALIPWALPRGTALATALLFIATPLVPWWGHTTAVEPGAACSVVVAFFAACFYVRVRDRNTLQGTVGTSLLLAGTTAFAVYFRPESLLVLPLVAAVLWSEEDHFLKDLFAWAALALVIALITPNLLHLWSVRGEDWGATDGRRFDFEFIAKNFSSNAGYFFANHWFPLAGTLLAVIGGGWLLVRNLGAALVLALWLALSWGIFILFYAGGYHYGASSRYALVSCAPVAVLMGVGAARLVGALRAHRLIGGALTAALVINWLAVFAFVPTESQEASEAREDTDFIVHEAARLPHAALVISHAPSVWLVEGANSCELTRVEQHLRGNLRELVNQYPGGIFFHFGYWDNVEPAFGQNSAQLFVDMGAIEVVRRPCREHQFALFRLDTPAALERFGGPKPEHSDPIVRLDALLNSYRKTTEGNPAPPAPADAKPSQPTAP